MRDEPDLVSLIRRLVQEEVHRLVGQTDSATDPHSQSLEEVVQEEVKRALAPIPEKPIETIQRPTYAAAVMRKSRDLGQRAPIQQRQTDLWRTADNRPVCFHCGRPGHVVRYCRERKAVFDNYRFLRQNADELDTEEEFCQPNLNSRSEPSLTRGRSAIRRSRSPSPYRRSSPSHQVAEMRKTKRSDLPRR